MFVTSNGALLAQLSAIKTAMLELATPGHSVVKLAQGAFNPTPQSVPADFTEADYTGYASKNVTGWTPPELDPGPAAKILGTNLIHFQPSGTTVTNLVTGYWIEDGNGDYVGAEKFSAAIPMADVDNAVSLVVQWQVAASTWSGLVIN